MFANPAESPGMFFPKSSSTCFTKGVLLASEVPVMIKALLDDFGRQAIRYFVTESAP